MWPQEVVWLPPERARTYGDVTAGVRAAFGIDPPENRTPLFLHPQPPLAHHQLARIHGSSVLEDVRVTPTASYRSVVAWRRGRFPVMLKLSIGAIIGRLRRRLRENQIARGVLMSAVFDTIPPAHREQLGFDWFSEPAGVVETLSGHGWLLRLLPRALRGSDGQTLVPMFSLISARGDRPPLLVELIQRSGADAEAFVIDTILQPYVNAVAYLLFVQGIQVEAHSQNTLMEIDADEGLTRRLVFRDLSDTSISIPLRVARGKPLPRFEPGFLPSGAPFPLASVATDYACNFDRPILFRAFDTVERYGLSGFVWALNASLVRSFPAYDAARIDGAYLALWQNAAVRYLGVKPLFRDDPKGLATDEGLAFFLRRVDWLFSGPGTSF